MATFPLDSHKRVSFFPRFVNHIACMITPTRRAKKKLCDKVRRVVFADVFGATSFRVDGTPLFSEGVLVLFNLVSSEFQILMRT